MNARPRPVLPAATVLGHIIFAIFANPGLAAFSDEKFESAPLQKRVRQWRFRGLDVAAPRLLKLWPNRLACLPRRPKSGLLTPHISGWCFALLGI